MKANKGFTLIELLVVIAIIGLLSSVVLASMNSARKKSRDARRQQDLKSLQVALELFFDTNGGYPVQTTGTAAAAQAIIGNATNNALGTAQTTHSIVPTYIGQVSDDPSSGRDYYYVSDAASGTYATTYCIGAFTEQATVTSSSCSSGLTTIMATIQGSTPSGAGVYRVGP